jgi:hypothetical protein
MGAVKVVRAPSEADVFLIMAMVTGRVVVGASPALEEEEEVEAIGNPTETARNPRAGGVS